MKLNDYSLFRKYVKYNSKLDILIPHFLSIGFGLLAINLLATISVFSKYKISFKYF